MVDVIPLAGSSQFCTLVARRAKKYHLRATCAVDPSVAPLNPFSIFAHPESARPRPRLPKSHPFAAISRICSGTSILFRQCNGNGRGWRQQRPWHKSIPRYAPGVTLQRIDANIRQLGATVCNYQHIARRDIPVHVRRLGLMECRQAYKEISGTGCQARASPPPFAPTLRAHLNTAVQGLLRMVGWLTTRPRAGIEGKGRLKSWTPCRD